MALQVRPFRAEDRGAVLGLLRVALGSGPGGERSPEFFRWKHVENPFGESLMLVAETAGRIVGLRAFMRWRFKSGDRWIRAVRAVDTATHPEFQGRGIFSQLTLQGLEALRGEADLVFNTPNEKSLPGYLKMGWRVVGRVRISVRVNRPLRFLRRIRSLRRISAQVTAAPPVQAETVAETLGRAEDLPRLLAEALEGDGRLQTPVDLDFLRWRYGSAPLLDYRTAREPEDGPLRGLAIFRVRPRGALWEATVADLIVGGADQATARALLQGVATAVPVDHLTCRFRRGSAPARAARAGGFFPAPGGMTLAVKPLCDDIEPDPTSMDSWDLCLGDLEVF